MDKKIPPHKEAALQAIMAQFKGNERGTQRSRLLAALTQFPITTYEASRGLDIYYPPARIKELRNDGYEIDTLWRIIETEHGAKHRVGLYVLRSLGGAHG
jgi:hypothetical protein